MNPRSNQNLEKFPEENPNPVFRIGKNGHLLYCNKASCELLSKLNIKKEKEVPKELRGWVDSAFHDKTKKVFEISIAGQVYEFDVMPIVNTEYANVYVQNITRRKEAEEALKKAYDDMELKVKERTAQLEQANKELEAFNYSVSHDLRSPLITIIGFSKLLMARNEDQLNEQGKKILKQVISSSNYMNDLLESLLSLSNKSLSDFNYEQVDLSRIGKKILGKLQETEPERNVEIVIEDGMTAKGDKTLLQGMLQNLLDNAWKYTRKNPLAKIEFKVKTNDKEQVYFVRDNGAGFDMGYADKLFVPLQRLHRDDEFPGSGIGLATVQRIIHRHGGKIWAEAEEGKGATFYFTLRAFTSV